MFEKTQMETKTPLTELSVTPPNFIGHFHPTRWIMENVWSEVSPKGAVWELTDTLTREQRVWAAHALRSGVIWGVWRGWERHLAYSPGYGTGFVPQRWHDVTSLRRIRPEQHLFQLSPETQSTSTGTVSKQAALL